MKPCSCPRGTERTPRRSSSRRTNRVLRREEHSDGGQAMATAMVEHTNVYGDLGMFTAVGLTTCS